MSWRLSGVCRPYAETSYPGVLSTSAWSRLGDRPISLFKEESKWNQTRVLLTLCWREPGHLIFISYFWVTIHPPPKLSSLKHQPFIQLIIPQVDDLDLRLIALWSPLESLIHFWSAAGQKGSFATGGWPTVKCKDEVTNHVSLAIQQPTPGLFTDSSKILTHSDDLLRPTHCIQRGKASCKASSYSKHREIDSTYWKEKQHLHSREYGYNKGNNCSQFARTLPYTIHQE